jgi:Tfp pilus assembly protein FimT
MLLVITLVSILSAVAFPYFLRQSPAARAGRAAEAVANSMRLARFRAISMNREVYFHFEPGSAKNFVTAYVNLGNPGDVPTGTKAEVAAVSLPSAEMNGSWLGIPLPDGVRFDAGAASTGPDGNTILAPIDLSPNPIVFNGRGMVVSAPPNQLWMGAVYIAHEKNPNAVRAVTISQSGLVKVWHLQGSTWK